MSSGLMSFCRETDYTQSCPRTVNVCADEIPVGNDAFASGDFHGSNS
jgi:hypothetical protein